MAQAGQLTVPPPIPSPAGGGGVGRGRRAILQPVTVLRIGIIVAILASWQLVAASGLLYRDVVPSLAAITIALYKTLSDPTFYFHLGTTAYEIAIALTIGGLSGLAVGIALGASKLLARAYEAYLYYLGPTPKIIFFPVMIMWFGVGAGSKIAMGAVSCFFPIALNVAVGMREIDPVLIRVGNSFRANTWQMVTKIYLPAMRYPVINGLRIGLGVALIGTLLAETKLSNRGIGFLVIQAYSLFNMPQMYSLLIVLFVIAIGANALIGRLGGLADIKRA
jgi:NitT/TauT family transport system permease protein